MKATKIVSIVLIILLLGCALVNTNQYNYYLFNYDYLGDYYLFTKSFGLLAFVFLAYSNWQEKRVLLTLVFLTIGVIFNPIRPLGFSETAWVLLDWLTILILLYTLFENLILQRIAQLLSWIKTIKNPKAIILKYSKTILFLFILSILSVLAFNYYSNNKPLPTLEQIKGDPEFAALPFEVQSAVLERIKPGFKALPIEVQQGIIAILKESEQKPQTNKTKDLHFSDVQKQEGYINAPPEIRKQIRDDYFNDKIAPSLNWQNAPQEVYEQARADFESQFGEKAHSKKSN